jgi:hypothetical protein
VAEHMPNGITIAMKIRGMLGIRRPTLLRNPITSIGWNIQAFSSAGMQNIWWLKFITTLDLSFVMNILIPWPLSFLSPSW